MHNHAQDVGYSGQTELEQLVEIRTRDLLEAYFKIDERQEDLRKIASIVSASLDHMSLLDVNYVYQVVNNSYLEYWGKTREMIIGHSVSDLLGQELFDQNIRPLLDECLAGHSVNYEAWFDFPRHGRRFMNVSYHPYHDRHGAVSGIVVVSRDVTELKKISLALQESEQRFRNLFDAMPSGVAVYQPTDNGEDFVFRDFNKSAERISRCSAATLAGQRVTEMFPGIKKMGLLQAFQEVNASGNPRTFSISLYEDDRLSQWVENYIYKLPNGELVAIYDDWTDKKNAEETIRNLAKFPNENPYPVLRVTRDGTLIFANPGARPLLQAWQCQVGDKLPARQRDLFQQVIDSGRHQVVEESLGKQHFSLNLVPFPEAGYVNLYAMDITPIKHLLRQVEEQKKAMELMNQQLEWRVRETVREIRDKDAILIHQSRRAAMGEMINNIAHQWRQPLNTLALVLANIESECRESITDDSPLFNKISKGYQIIRQMSQTIDDFRCFFRPEKTPHSFNICKIIQDALLLLETTFTNLGIALQIIIDQPVIAVHGYPNELSQTLLILLSNAKDAIQESQSKPGKITIHVIQNTQNGIVVVEDNGGGIPVDILDKIFDPYFTTKMDSQGTGIGLYMAKMIIERNMQGRLLASNIPGGARFEIRLPLSDRV
ncbi:MAG: PAS domain-containing protein [Magnetococcales bacterium]|nr:PAS domain-containing protein [Magnetococcales bacterium]